jgi:ATP-dependent RNA helicase DDX56/DBP9
LKQNVLSGLLGGLGCVTFQVLVLDEADLLLSYGHAHSLQIVARLVPSMCQCILMSATTSADVEELSKLMLQKPVHLDFTHSSAGPGEQQSRDAIEHFQFSTSHEEKPLAVLALLKLHLVKKKV